MMVKSNQVTDQLMRVINRIIFSEKRNTFQLEGVTLYPSEIHLVLLIHHDLDTNATKMAEIIGLTKGAISQTLSRLEKKGILKKNKDPYNKNELSISFTSFGRRALRQFLKLEERFRQKHGEYFSALNEGDRETIYSFLLHMEDTFDRSR